MQTMLQKYQNYPNGMTNNTNGVFEYLGIHLAAMNESLMQSYNDKIRVFPAVPGDGGFVGKFTLLAKDGFLVSSEREAGETKYVGLRSLHGKQARVVNPWGTQQIRVRRTRDNAILTTVSAAEVTFATAANTTYVVERTAKPLTGYAATTLTGTANQGAKSLSGTASTLGLGPAGQGGLVNDTDLTYGAELVPHHGPRLRRLQRRHPPQQHRRRRGVVHVHRHRRRVPVRTLQRHGQRRRLPRQRLPDQREPERLRAAAGAAGGLQPHRPGERLSTRSASSTRPHRSAWSTRCGS